MATSEQQKIQETAEAIGMPQLNSATFDNQLFWLLITLVVLFVLLSRTVLPRIATILSERSATITGDIALAEDLRKKAVDIETNHDKEVAKLHEQSHTLIEQARADAHSSMARKSAEINARLSEEDHAFRYNVTDSESKDTGDAGDALPTLADLALEARSETTKIAAHAAQIIVHRFLPSLHADTLDQAIAQSINKEQQRANGQANAQLRQS